MHQDARPGAWVYDTRLLESQFVTWMRWMPLSIQEPETRLMLLWEPPSLDDRIANQSGMLTFMNSATGSQNAFLADYSKLHPLLVHRVIIAAESKPEIRAMLDQNNISERTLFPVCRTLRWLKRTTQRRGDA